MSLKVTAFNILAPVWASPELYTSGSLPLLDPSARNRIVADRLLELSSDAVMMEEVEAESLENMRGTTQELDEKYTIHFAPFPAKLWSNWLTSSTNFEPRENGLCIMLSKSEFTEVTFEQVCIDPDDGQAVPEYSRGNFSLLAHCYSTKWKRRVTFVCTHADADSTTLAGRQMLYLHQKLVNDLVNIKGSDDTDPVVIWGGDFNLELRSHALSHIQSKHTFTCCFEGFKNITTASVYGKPGSARIDHIFATTAVKTTGTDVPECPLPYVIGTLPVHTTFGWLKESVLPSAWRKVVLVILLLLLLPVTLMLALVMVFQTRQAAARSEWALREYGSDHLPVTCTLQLGNKNLTNKLQP